MRTRSVRQRSITCLKRRRSTGSSGDVDNFAATEARGNGQQSSVAKRGASRQGNLRGSSESGQAFRRWPRRLDNAGQKHQCYLETNYLEKSVRWFTFSKTGNVPNNGWKRAKKAWNKTTCFHQINPGNNSGYRRPDGQPRTLGRRNEFTSRGQKLLAPYQSLQK